MSNDLNREKMIKDFEDRLDEFTSNYSYRNSEPMTLSKDDILLVNKEIGSLSSNKGAWSFNYMLEYSILHSFYKNPNFFKDLYEDGALNEKIFSLLYSNEIFFGDDCHFKVASNELYNEDIRASAVSKVDCHDKLEELSKSKSAKVRASAYSVLGIRKNIEKIAKDKSKEVRMIGIANLPFGSPILKTFLEKEKASRNLILLAKKMSSEDLLFAVGTKNRSKWGDEEFKKIIRSRLGC